jgi:hypothetical protein
MALSGVVLLVQRAVRIEVVAPAGQLEAVVAEGTGSVAQLLERQVGPLAGEETDGRAWQSSPA